MGGPWYLQLKGQVSVYSHCDRCLICSKTNCPFNCNVCIIGSRQLFLLKLLERNHYWHPKQELWTEVGQRPSTLVRVLRKERPVSSSSDWWKHAPTTDHGEGLVMVLNKHRYNDILQRHVIPSGTNLLGLNLALQQTMMPTTTLGSDITTWSRKTKTCINWSQLQFAWDELDQRFQTWFNTSSFPTCHIVTPGQEPKSLGF